MYKGLFGIDIEVGTNEVEVADGNTALVILTSETLDWSVEKVTAVVQVGRFVLVRYIPVQQEDPALIVCTAGAQHFNQAMRLFQEAREPAPMRYWRQQVRRARFAVLAQLGRLQPSVDETIFVSQWTARILAHGIPAPHLFEREML